MKKLRNFLSLFLFTLLIGIIESGNGCMGQTLASTIHTIPSNDLTAVNASYNLNIGSSTYSSCIFAGVSGVSVGTAGIYSDCKYWNIYVPYNQQDMHLTDFLDINFQNVGTIGGRKINAKIHCDSLDFTQEAVINNGTYHKDGYMQILKLYYSTVEIVGESAGSLRLKTTVTITYADTGEVVNLPFYQKIADIDSIQTYIQQPESWEGISGFTGDLYVYQPYYSGGIMQITGMKARVIESNRGTGHPGSSGDDEMLKAGLFAPTYNGSFTCEFGENNCGTLLTVYSAYDDRNLPTPSKDVAADAVKEPGDIITYTITQPVSSFYGNTFTLYDFLNFEDNLPKQVEYVSADLYAGDKNVTSEYGYLEYSESLHMVRYVFKDEILEDTNFYNGGNLSLKIKTKAKNEGKTIVTAKNKGIVNIGKVVKETNEVQVTINPLYDITTSATNGTITQTETGISRGSNRTITWSPKSGYYIKSLKVDGNKLSSSKAESGIYTFTNIQSDHEVVVECSPYYSVITKIDEGGEIKAGSNTIKEGEDYDVSWVAKDGFYITKVTIDGTVTYSGNKVNGYPTEYSFSNINSNHSVEVTTAKIPFLKITKNSDQNTYNYLDTVTYRIVVEQTIEGAVADDVVITDKDMTKGLELDLSSITVNHSDAKIEVEENSFTIYLEQLNYNDPVTITVKGKVNHDMLESKDIRNTAKVSSVQTEEIMDEAEVSLYYRVETKVTNGTITESDYEVTRGENRTVSYEPDDGFYLACIKVDGEEQSLSDYAEEITLENIKANYTVEAVFAKIPALSVQKKADRRVYTDGDTVTYTVVVENIEEDSVAEDVVIADMDLPDGLVLDEAGITCDSGIYELDTGETGFSVTVPELAYGKSITVTYEAMIKGERLTKSEVTNTVTAAFTNGRNVTKTVRDKAEIVVQFTIKTVVVNGSITEPVKQVCVGENKTITYEAQSGYEMKSLIVDGKKQSLSDYRTEYTFSNIHTNHCIKVIFDKILEPPLKKSEKMPKPSVKRAELNVLESPIEKSEKSIFQNDDTKQDMSLASVVEAAKKDTRTVRLKEDTVPETGDNTSLWPVLLLLIGSGLCLMTTGLVSRLKKKG